MKRFILPLVFGIIAIICLSFFLGCKTATLSAPVNLRFENRTLYWNAVEGADSYVVFFDDKEYEVKDCFFDFSKTGVYKNYTVEVMSVADGKNNSDWSEISFVITEPKESGYDDKGFFYTLVNDEGYELSRGNADIEGELVLPDYYDGLPVIGIAEKAFNASESLYVDCITESYCNTVTTGVTLPSRLKYLGNLSFKHLVRIEEVVFPDTVTVIGDSAFFGCKRLAKIKLPKNLKSILSSAFTRCALKDLYLPEGLEYIGYSAFDAFVTNYYNDLPVYTEQSFEKLVLPSTVKFIGARAFMGCTRLKEVTFLCENLEYANKSSFSKTLLDTDEPGAHFITGEKTVDGKMEKYALLWKYNDAETETYELRKPADTKLYVAGAAFSNTKLKRIIIGDGIKLSGGSSFAMCAALEEVVLPSDLTLILAGTFVGDYKLTQIIIPDGVVTIEEDAFQNCTSLKEVSLPEGVISIGNRCFRECHSLKELILPEGLISIGNWAFSGCSSLKTVILPKSLTVGNYAPFKNCASLESVFYTGSKGEWDNFSDSSPYFLVDFNETAKIYTYSEKKPTAEGNFWRYVDGVPTIW